MGYLVLLRIDQKMLITGKEDSGIKNMMLRLEITYTPSKIFFDLL